MTISTKHTSTAGGQPGSRADARPAAVRATTELNPDMPLQLAALAPTVTVIGDVILDTWIYGTSERLAREAPAPVVDRTHEVFAPGGAANTAMNLAALGARVRMVGLTGDDDSGARLRELLTEAGVDTELLLADPAVKTTTKSRVVVDGQVLFRLDTACGEAPDGALARLADAGCAAATDTDAVVVCDYDGAVHRTELATRLGSLAERPLVVVDAHDPRHWAPARPDLVTPNCGEAEAVLEDRLGAGKDRVDAVVRHHVDLLERTGAGQVVVTLDKDGTALVDASGLVHRTWANPATEKQASGAGDTFVAALTLARAADLPVPAAVDLAQAAADVVVHRLGTSLCSTGDLVRHLSDVHDALVPTDELLARVREHRAAGQRIILTNGCFDVLHRGHTAYLNKAKQLGDVLIVAVNDDDSVRRLKGPDRPVNPLSDRAGVLASLSSVDYVTSFSTDTPIPLISELEPDIYVKGGDYTPEMLAETAVVEAHGGQVRIMDYVSDHSTTAVVERMRRRTALNGALNGEGGGDARA
ncbi:D-glycero-beta-D-manno-heptose 1-phosphate adenylyltransferase [Corynebacterium halotolerans]|uniref:D-glycero-beta-D-manno-heptose 1-phosphate adenylyltransferase n=1 Tax=Corynebacterium halotolerans YIM 70093 = DSM 44683 TaxID=1121362 RepID=M1NL31_9CORY|nr:D-glycero-beta-D-manno-heptose 1-phosphate adenylyltransferase [Corynebacterium halotolerans]AGF72103.1 D-beta-D-heptose 1-phosphate adenylyltransferase / D-alpha,beta-D-heptose 7-phosphate 1-kinase [Corynebacterium halotolerans YIM 70093 = DSM 44683]